MGQFDGVYVETLSAAQEATNVVLGINTGGKRVERFKLIGEQGLF